MLKKVAFFKVTHGTMRYLKKSDFFSHFFYATFRKKVRKIPQKFSLTFRAEAQLPGPKFCPMGLAPAPPRINAKRLKNLIADAVLH